MTLRKAARGRPCTIRLPGCDGGGETTVLAHFRLAGLCGIGQKPHDIIGAHACASCHDIADGRRVPPFGSTKADVRLAHALGVLRTLDALVRDGYELRRIA